MRKVLITVAAILGAMLSISSASAQSSHDHRLSGQAAPDWRPELLVREQTPASGDRTRPVLYIHGSSFPSASSVMFRFGGTSWADALNVAGLNVFALDFAGYGGSERYPVMASEDPVGTPPGRALEAAEQIARAVAFIREQTGASRVSVIAHSWGTIPAALFTIQHPEAIDRLVLFGPILERQGPPASQTSRWSLVTIAQQHARFVGGVPAGHAPVLEEADFPRWASVYLASDPHAGERTPASVKIPSGPAADLLAAWSGRLGYDPGDLARPVMLVRGEWDTPSSAADAAWFESKLASGLEYRIVTVPDATHLMHLEAGRHALYAATNAFLAGTPSSPQRTRGMSCLERSPRDRFRPIPLKKSAIATGFRG